MSQTATRTRTRKNAKASIQEGADRERCTLLIDADLSMKLSIRGASAQTRPLEDDQ